MCTFKQRENIIVLEVKDNLKTVFIKRKLSMERNRPDGFCRLCMNSAIPMPYKYKLSHFAI